MDIVNYKYYNLIFHIFTNFSIFITINLHLYFYKMGAH